MSKEHTPVPFGAYPGFSPSEADKRLIAAAPELLEACKAFVVAWEKCLQLEKTDVALMLAKIAIAKAAKKGE